MAKNEKTADLAPESPPPPPSLPLAQPRLTGPATRKETTRPPPTLEFGEGGIEHRQFPRTRMAVRFYCWIGPEEHLRFSATFTSVDLSVSGVFLASTFFLPIGTELWVRFALEDGGTEIQARGEILREERPDPKTGQGRSGFGMRFVEFYGQTEVTLAKLFLGAQVRTFAEEYLASKRARSLGSELDRVVDALAAWELLKVTTPGDPWRPLQAGEAKKK